MPDDRRPIDESIVEDALAALAGRECEHDGGLLDPRTGQCAEESHTHCRWFCGDAYCGHQFISWNDDAGYDGPAVPIPPSWLGPVSEWPDAWKQDAFGDLLQLADCFAEVEDGHLSDLQVFDIAELLAGQLSVAVHSEGWEQLQSHASGGGTVVYAEDPGQAWTELEAALAGLRRRFEQLAVSESGIEEIQAEEVLAILADLECPNCRSGVVGRRPWFCSDCRTAVCLSCHDISNDYPCSHLLPTEGRPGWDHKTCVACGEALQGWRCAGCLSVHCPFCGVRSWAWRGSSWALGETRCPHLIASWCESSGEWQVLPVADKDVGFERLAQVAVHDRDGGAARTAFGDFIGLATLEEELASQRPTGALDALIKQARLSAIIDVWWDDENGMSSDTGTDYFAPVPGSVVAALHALIDRLAARQERLSGVARPQRAPDNCAGSQTPHG
jgi:hypothetical protein